MRYDRTHTTRVYMKLSNQYDKDILDKLDSVPNKQGYIKECIRAEMARNSESSAD